MLEWRLKAYRRWLTMKEPHWPNVHYPPDRLPGDQRTTRRRRRVKPLQSLDEVDPGAAAHVREARHPAQRAEDARRRRRRRDLRFGVRRHDDEDGAREARHHLLLVRRSGARASRAGREVSRLGRAVQRQLFRRAEQRRLLATARSVYVPKGVRCPMELSTYFRINAADTGQFERTLIVADEGAYGQLSRRLHRAEALDEPAACGGRGARRARRRDDEVQHGAELVRGRRGRQGRHLQLRHEARQVRAASTPRSRGRRSRRARRSRGNIRA